MKKLTIVLIISTFYCGNIFAAEAGMPQLDPKYWASQAFWLIIIFSTIYLLIDKVFIPKIKGNIDTRENKIRKDLEEAKIFREEAEKKLIIYKKLIQTASQESKKIVSDSSQKLNEDIQNKKNEIQNQIDKELISAENEIMKFKKDSFDKVGKISEDIVTEVIKDIFGEDGNKSKISATVNEILKKENVKV